MICTQESGSVFFLGVADVSTPRLKDRDRRQSAMPQAFTLVLAAYSSTNFHELNTEVYCYMGDYSNFEKIQTAPGAEIVSLCKRSTQIWHV